jgi:hypothetical protein
VQQPKINQIYITRLAYEFDKFKAGTIGTPYFADDAVPFGEVSGEQVARKSSMFQRLSQPASAMVAFDVEPVRPRDCYWRTPTCFHGIQKSKDLHACN